MRGDGLIQATRLAAAAVAVALAACGGGSGAGGVSPDEWPVPDRRAACYDLRYGGEAAATRFPRMLVIDRGGSSGRAFWFPAARSDTGWRDFYAHGHWARQGRGRIHVSFDTGDTKVELDLEQQDAGMVVGRASRREGDDAGGERAAALEGRHVSCPRAPTPEAG